MAYSVHEAGCLSGLHYMPESQRFTDASEGVGFPTRRDRAGKEQTLPSLVSSYRPPAEAVALLKMCLPTSRPGLGVDLPTSN